MTDYRNFLFEIGLFIKGLFGSSILIGSSIICWSCTGVVLNLNEARNRSHYILFGIVCSCNGGGGNSFLCTSILHKLAGMSNFRFCLISWIKACHRNKLTINVVIKNNINQVPITFDNMTCIMISRLKKYFKLTNNTLEYTHTFITSW